MEVFAQNQGTPSLLLVIIIEVMGSQATFDSIPLKLYQNIKDLGYMIG